MASMEGVFVSKHPLVKHKIGLIRSESTCCKDFRELVGELGALLAYEVTQDLPLTECVKKTWVGEVKCEEIAGRKLTLVPILRAGLGMLHGFQTVLPNARVSVLGMQRNEETLEATEYYQKLTSAVHERTAIIVDPMLATGGSLIGTIQSLKKAGVTDIRACVLIAAPEGIANLKKTHPDVPLYTGSVDECLNEKGYIIPGLGDAGDRIFGTVI